MSIKKIDLRTLNEWVEGLVGKQKIIGARPKVTVLSLAR